MGTTELEVARATKRMQITRADGYVTAASYDERAGRIIVEMNTGIHFSFPVALAQGLADATPRQRKKIEISPSGLGLHWPAADVDLYVPSLIGGQFGSRSWMAGQLGAAGGAVRSDAKSNSARINGRKGGRPRAAPAKK